MIFTASVIDGFKVILGSLPLQFAMMVTIITMIRVPLDSEGEYETEALACYIWLVLLHLILWWQVLVNHYSVSDNPQLYAVSNVVLLMLQVGTQAYLCVNFVFPAEPNPAWTEDGTKGDWTQFLFWTKVEVLIFTGYIGSPILFQFVRAFKRTTFELVNPATGESPDADVLESNMLTVGIFCSFCAPLLTTTFITYEGHYHLLEEETRMFTSIMWWM